MLSFRDLAKILFWSYLGLSLCDTGYDATQLLLASSTVSLSPISGPHLNIQEPELVQKTKYHGLPLFAPPSRCDPTLSYLRMEYCPKSDLFQNPNWRRKQRFFVIFITLVASFLLSPSFSLSEPKLSSFFFSLLLLLTQFQKLAGFPLFHILFALMQTCRSNSNSSLNDKLWGLEEKDWEKSSNCVFQVRWLMC